MRFLNLEKVLEKVGLSRSSVLRLEKAKEFPQRVQVKGVNLWLEHEVDAWIDATVTTARA